MDFLSADAMPWLQQLQQQFREAVTSRRLPHSILLLSTPGLGAEALARWMTALVLCESRGGEAAGAPPCGVCASCALLRVNSHPDYHVVRVEDEAKQIKVDQVRGLIGSLSFKSYRGGYKVAVIEGAEALNVNGANAFLKTLEEPSADTVLILIARPTHRLPATIASRCLRWVVRTPAQDMVLAWLRSQGDAHDWTPTLQLAGGAPLLALDLHQAGIAALEADMQENVRALSAGAVDVTLLADYWVKSNLPLRIVWLENWITWRLRTALGGEHSSHSAERVCLPAALLKPKMRALFELLDAIREVRRLASTGMNQQLALEALLLGGRTALTH